MSDSNLFGLSAVGYTAPANDHDDIDFDFVDFGLIDADADAIDLLGGDESADILAWERAEQRERGE